MATEAPVEAMLWRDEACGAQPSRVRRDLAPTAHAGFRRPALPPRLGSALFPSPIDCALALVFSSFLAIQILRHTLWRDELNAWAIVLASPSLSDLFAHLHYEAHPGLWHLLLWFASHISSAPQAMQVVHAAIGCSIIFVIALASPFSRLEKTLLLLGYFVLFEYTVVSRNYGIGLLIALIYAQRRAASFDSVKINAALLGLLANTNLFALILSGAFALEYAEALSRQSQGAKHLVSRLVGPSVVYFLFLWFSIATLWPAKDLSWRTSGEPLAAGLTLDRLLAVVVNNASSLVPIDQASFWASTQMIDPTTHALACVIVLALVPVLIVMFGRIFRDMPSLLIIPLLTFVGSMTFNLVFYSGSVRHWGINFVAFLCALWIQRASTGRANAWPLPILALNAVAGVLFTIQHWSVPLSNSGATADWLKDHGFEHAALIGTPDTHVAAVAELLGRPAYFLDCRCTDTYLAFHNRRDDFSRADVVSRLAEASRSVQGQTQIYLDIAAASSAEVQGLAEKGLQLDELAFVSGAVSENFHVYAVRRADEPSATSDGLGLRKSSEPNG